MKFLKRYAYMIWTGIVLHLCNIHAFQNWQFYVVSIPLILLVEWKAYK